MIAQIDLLTIQELVGHAEAWHVGAALLAMAIGSRVLKLLWRAASIRGMCLIVGAAILWPDVSRFVPEVVRGIGEGSTEQLMVLGVGSMLFVLSMLPSGGKAAVSLSDPATRLLDRINKLTVESCGRLDSEYLQSAAITIHSDWPFDPWYAFTIDGMNLSKIVPDRTEHRRIVRRSKEVWASLLQEQEKRRVSNALNKL